MPNNFLILAQLMRLTEPTGYLLAFFPAAFGLLLATKDNLKPLILLPLFFIGSILGRSVGCVINDILDRKVDILVERTKNRPIASGKITIGPVLVLLTLLLITSFAILASLTVTSITIGFITFFMILLYPLMKRLTNFPQIFLGLTFNLGSLIGFSAIKDSINLEVIIMYIGCCFWTIGYDTIYAFMDIEDDKKIGINSTAIVLEHRPYKIYLGICYSIFILFFILANCLANGFNIMKCYLVVIGACLAYIILIWQVKTIKINSLSSCQYRFKVNNYVGLILTITMLLESII